MGPRHRLSMEVSGGTRSPSFLHQYAIDSGVQELMASDLSDAAIEAVVRRLADDTLAHAPGTVYEYSNANFNILGLIVQTVAGESYERYIQEHIFDPLEMRQSFTSLEPAAAAGGEQPG